MEEKPDFQKLVPKESFARWLASDETAARLKNWMVYRLPALGLGEAMDDRLEAIYGFEPRNQPDANAWFWGVFENRCRSGLRCKPEAGPICLHDRAAGRLYHASIDARSLFEPTGDWEEAREPEREVIAALHEKAKAIVADRLAEPAIREQALKAFDDKGDEAFAENKLIKLMGSTFVSSGGLDRDFVADAIHRLKIPEPWGPALAEWLDDEDEAARKRADSILAEEAQWLGGAIRRQQKWDEAVRDHGAAVAEALGMSFSMHDALQKLDAKTVHLVFEASGCEAVAKIKLQRLLMKLEDGRPLSVAPFEVDQVDDCSAVLEGDDPQSWSFAVSKLKAVRFRRKDVWTRDLAGELS